MPNPLDYLKQAASWATTPIVPKEAIQGTQDAIDSPTLDRSPLEAQIRGFGAGALEGLRGLTTPLGIASMVGGGSGLASVGGATTEGAEALAGGLGATLPEYAPLGGEAAVNASRMGSTISKALPNPAELGYQGALNAGRGLQPWSEAGQISPEQAIATGLTGAGAAYAGKKAYDALKGMGSAVNSKVNPFQVYSDKMKQAGQ